MKRILIQTVRRNLEALFQFRQRMLILLAAEDNPTNDYPEEEVSTDDEYDVNPYQYRQYHSEDDDDYYE